jgi:cytochrome b561
MLEQLKHFANKLALLRIPSLVLAVLVLPVLMWIITASDSPSQDIFLIPALILFVWLLLLYSFLSLFAEIPPIVPASSPWQVRAGAAIKRGLYYLVAVCMLLITNALLITSLQLFGAWWRMY